MKRRITNASPLILLAKLGRLDLLRLGADEVLVPSAALEEVYAKSDVASEETSKRLGTWLKPCLVTRPDLSRLFPDLGSGERDVLVQAIQEGISSVVLDDLDARRTARRMGMKPVGTVGLLLAAKKRGMIPLLRKELNTLEELGFWISDSLVEEALREAGEE